MVNKNLPRIVFLLMVVLLIISNILYPPIESSAITEQKTNPVLKKTEAGYLKLNTAIDTEITQTLNELRPIIKKVHKADSIEEVNKTLVKINKELKQINKELKEELLVHPDTVFIFDTVNIINIDTITKRKKILGVF